MSECGCRAAVLAKAHEYDGRATTAHEARHLAEHQHCDRTAVMLFALAKHLPAPEAELRVIAELVAALREYEEAGMSTAYPGREMHLRRQAHTALINAAQVTRAQG